MFVQIGDTLPRFRDYERLYSSHKRLTLALSRVYLDILRFCEKAKATLQKAKSKSNVIVNTRIALKVSWKTFDHQFGALLADFRLHRKSVEKEAELSHMIEAEQSQALVKQDRLALQRQKEEAEQFRLISRLSTIQWEKGHVKLLKLRQAGTGNWIFSDNTYRQWKTSSESSWLAMYGIPGSGKSVLRYVAQVEISFFPRTNTKITQCWYH